MAIRVVVVEMLVCIPFHAINTNTSQHRRFVLHRTISGHTSDGSKCNKAKERNAPESTVYRTAPHQDNTLGKKEDDCAQHARDARRNNPRQKHLRSALPPPVDLVDAHRGGGGPNKTAYNTVCRGNRHAVSGRDGEEDGRRHDGAHHGQEQHLRRVGKETGVDDAGADGVGDAAAHGDAAGELADRGNGHGLLQRKRPRGYGAGERVGDIVGACAVVLYVRLGGPRRFVGCNGSTHQCSKHLGKRKSRSNRKCSHIGA